MVEKFPEKLVRSDYNFAVSAKGELAYMTRTGEDLEEIKSRIERSGAGFERVSVKRDARGVVAVVVAAAVRAKEFPKVADAALNMAKLVMAAR